MKLASRLAALAFALAVASPAIAQDRPGGKFGVGVGLSDGGVADTLVFVPLNVSPKLRVEPFLGLDRSDIDAPPAGAGGSTSIFSGSGKESHVLLGVGAFFVQPIVSQIQLYAGGRLGLQWDSAEEAGPNADEWSRRNTILAAALGGEYLPHPRIAIGGEVMLAYVSLGDTEFTNGVTGQKFEGNGGSATETQGTLFVRFYIF